MKYFLLIVIVCLESFFCTASEKKLRILMVVNKFPRITETFILGQIKALIDASFDVTILSVWRDETDIVQQDLIEYGLLKKVTYIDFYEEKNQEELCSFINQGNFDLLYCQYDKIGRIFARLKEKEKITNKMVCCIRGGDLIKKIESDRDGFSTLFSHASFILPVNNYFKKILVSNGFSEKKIIVQHSAIDLSKFCFQKRSYNKKRLNVVSVNRLIKGKGVDLAVKAMIKICKKYKQVHYYVVGNGVLFKSLKKIITKARLEKRIHLMGWKSHEKVKQILNESHIFLLASIGTDGIPNAIMEASASGLPVVSTTYGGIPEIVQNGKSGLLVKPGKVRSLVKMIDYLIRNSRKWGNFGKRGREIVEKNFDIKRENKSLVDIFKLVIRGKSLRAYKKYCNCYEL